MRLGALFFIAVSLAGAPAARAAERVLNIEAEILGPKEKSLGKTHLLVAARGTERTKAELGGITLVLDADVGPDLRQGLQPRHRERSIGGQRRRGQPRKRELTRTTIHACGNGTKPTTLAGGGTHQVVVTIRPAS
jgi:hypothetical protein